MSFEELRFETKHFLIKELRYIFRIINSCCQFVGHESDYFLLSTLGEIKAISKCSR